jgi:hypothetical protein
MPLKPHSFCLFIISAHSEQITYKHNMVEPTCTSRPLNMEGRCEYTKYAVARSCLPALGLGGGLTSVQRRNEETCYKILNRISELSLRVGFNDGRFRTLQLRVT